MKGGGKECGPEYMSDNPDQGAPVGIEEHRMGNTVRNEIEERRCKLRSADGDCGEPIKVVLHRSGYQAPHYYVIDMCSGFRSKVYHRGWQNVPSYSS